MSSPGSKKDSGKTLRETVSGNRRFANAGDNRTIPLPGKPQMYSPPSYALRIQRNIFLLLCVLREIAGIALETVE